MDAGTVPAGRVEMGRSLGMGRSHPRHNPEEGAAAVVVRLRRGYVVVTREDDGSTLLASPAAEGDWDRLWSVLESFGGGPVARTARTTGEDGARRPYVR